MPAYVEYPSRHPLLACVWEQLPPADVEHQVVPDGCVDLIWLADRELVFAGPDTRVRSVALPAGRLTSGVRLRPGRAGAVLGRPAAELRDQHVPAEEIWGARAGRLADELAAASAPRRLRLLADAVRGTGAVSDPVVVAAVRLLSTDPQARVAAVADRLGVGERLLHRRMTAAVGYGPKLFARIARLHRLLAATEESLADRAQAAGYASQAHMNADVAELAGCTPVRFLKDRGRLAS
jgi:AraC-like DNA-binding protein